MPDKPEIGKLRVLHELQNQFDVRAVKSTLESQLSNEDQRRINRFIAGFKIEGWFQWIFSALPWAMLIHGLDQHQLPFTSKEQYQVPDFLVIVETTALTREPLLVEVKRVADPKATLRIQDSQFALCENYAATLGIPLVFAIYWEKVMGWTLNTPDSFERRASTRKLPMTSAFELDCSLILGDVSYLVTQSLTRVSRFDENDVSESSVRHQEYGRLVSDVAVQGGNRIEMTTLESAAIDSMLRMKKRSVKRSDNGDTEIVESPDGNYLLKLSSWITHHQTIFNTTPTEEHFNVSAHVITDLMTKLDCPLLHMFPLGRSGGLKQLERSFMTSANANMVTKRRQD